MDILQFYKQGKNYNRLLLPHWQIKQRMWKKWGGTWEAELKIKQMKVY